MSKIQIEPNMTLRQVLHAVPQCAPVLECLGVNLTRDRGKSLIELGELRELDGCTVARLLAAMRDARPQFTVVCLELMTLVRLCDHLEFAHREIHDALKRLHQLVDHAVTEGDSADAQVVEIEKKFKRFRLGLTKHLQREAAELFPIIRRFAVGERVQFPSAIEFREHVRKFEREHIQVDDALAELATFAVNKACRKPVTVMVDRFSSAITALNQTLQKQIYAENALLFPSALGLASAL